MTMNDTQLVEQGPRALLDGVKRRLAGRLAAGGDELRLWLLRVSIGLTYFWFGALKFALGKSPAEALATATIGALSRGLIPAVASLRLLALWECVVGLCFLTGRSFRIGLWLMYLHMAGTTTALFLWPSQLFVHFPYQPTLEGQYIIKNLVFVSAAAVLAGAAAKKRR